MKSSYKALIISATILVVLGLAAPFAYSQVVNCCHWEGTGDEYALLDTDGDGREDDTVYVGQVWHANVIWPASDTSRDTIVGCWYDRIGNGGPLLGYRVRATDSAFGKFVLYTTNDPYCSDSISITPSSPLSVSFEAKWTGCCDEGNPDVSGDWAIGNYFGEFWDTAYTCNGDHVPQCE